MDLISVGGSGYPARTTGRTGYSRAKKRLAGAFAPRVRTLDANYDLSHLLRSTDTAVRVHRDESRKDAVA